MWYLHLPELVAGVEKDQAQHDSNDAEGHDQGDGGMSQRNERRASRDQDGQRHNGHDEIDDGFVHGGSVEEASG